MISLWNSNSRKSYNALGSPIFSLCNIGKEGSFSLPMVECLFILWANSLPRKLGSFLPSKSSLQPVRQWEVMINSVLRIGTVDGLPQWVLRTSNPIVDPLRRLPKMPSPAYG